MKSIQLGKLEFKQLSESEDMVATPVWNAAMEERLDDIYVSEIDPELADTAAFCEQYDIGLDVSANCVIVKAKRADRTWYVALMILATDFADVNKKVKKHVDARKLSFAPMDEAVELTNMEYGGITPIGLPKDWTILVDESVAKLDQAIIGSGIRGSKIITSGQTLASLPNAEVLDIKQS